MTRKVEKMNLLTAKEAICEVTEMFFKGASVIWTEQMNTKPPLPYITLKMGGVSKSTFPVIDEEDNRYYPCKATLEVNLYTKGKPVVIEKGVTGNYENTATSDMLDFFKFLESDIMVDILAGKGIDVMLMPPVRDLTDLQNDRSYRYRSMAEATVSWSEDADGPYGIGGQLIPNSSGGGSSEMAEAMIDEITEITISETEGGKDNDEE